MAKPKILQDINTLYADNAVQDVDILAKINKTDVNQLTCTIPISGWVNNLVTVTCTGMTSDCMVIVSPVDSSLTEYSKRGIKCVGQGTDTLTFSRKRENVSSIVMNVIQIIKENA